MIGNPYPLKQNAGKSFQGSIVLGKGFLLTPEQAEVLISKDPRNKDVLFPYLNGEDLNNDVEQKPSRWVINFFDWSEERAQTYPDCYDIAEKLVKPERLKQNDNGGKDKWWQYLRPRNELYETISKVDQVMVVPLVSKHTLFDFASTGIVYMHKLGVIVSNDYSMFAILSSTLHNIWCWKYSSTLGAGTLNYSTTDCFETFPFIDKQLILNNDKLNEIGKRYYFHRKKLMSILFMGLTKTYNQFHNLKLERIQENHQNVNDGTFEKLYGKESLYLRKHLNKHNNYGFNEACNEIYKHRNLHKELDNIILEIYGWNDLDLKHDFYEMDYLPENDRIRFTIHPDARKEILKRLLKLNHQIYRAEKNVSINKSRKSKKKHSSFNEAGDGQLTINHFLDQ